MRARHVGLGVVAALLYASCFAAIKLGLVYAPPLRFAAWRAGLGGSLLLVLLLIRGQPLAPRRRLWPATIALAVVGPVIGFFAMFESPRYTAVALASVVGNTGPLLIIVLASLFLAEPLSLNKIAAVVLGLSGVATIAASGSGPLMATSLAALALPLLAAASGASESVIVRWARPGPGVVSVAAWQYLLASVALFLLSAWREPAEAIVWSRRFVLLLALLAGGATAAATGIWYWLVQREEVSRLSLTLFLVPVAGLGAGVVLFGERVGAAQLAGVLLILAGVVVASFEGIRRAGEPRTAPGSR